MKKIAFILSTAALLLASCQESAPTLESKKAQLSELKSQLITIKSQINGLEKDLSSEDTKTAEKRVPVRIKQLEKESFSHYIAQPGKINSKKNVLVSAEMGGMVISLNAEEGQWVEEGQNIIQLDSTIMSAGLSELSSALELAKTTFQRQEKLWAAGIGSELQYLQIKNQYETLSKKFSASEAQLEKLSISAPISGYIEQVFLNKGELAAPGMPALRIVNTRKVYIEADVAERYANILKKNTPVKINFDALETSQNAPLSFVGQVINPENSTFKVKIELDNQDGTLKPNGLASLEIQDYVNDAALVVPSQIVKKDMLGDFIFVANKGKAEKVYIKLGLSQGDKSMILEGLKAGDKVITEGYSEVVSGSLVDIMK